MALSATCLWANLSELKPWLKLESSDVRHDGVLETLANAVTEELEEATARIFISRSISETRHGDGTARLVLRAYPVTAITTLTLDDEAVAADAYVLDADGGILTLLEGERWTRDIGNIRITYTAGYGRASLPSKVLRVAQDILSLYWQEWIAGAISAASVNIGSANLVIKPGWPYHVRDAVDQLRREFRVGVL